MKKLLLCLLCVLGVTSPWVGALSLVLGSLLLTVHPGRATAQVRAADAAEVTIRVLDSTEATVGDATVVLTQGTIERRVTTSADGMARLGDIPSGAWMLEVRREGFATLEQQVVVGSEPVTLDVTLELPTVTETVVVQGALSGLDTPAPSASRLDLSVRELPATLSVVTQETMRELGANFATDAIEAAGGTVSSDGLGAQLPGYQARGFSGTITHDGIRQNTTVQSSRPIDTFLLDRVEVLKGPAALMSGEGPAGGTVNYISKLPEQQLRIDSMLSFSSFGARRVGLGITGPLGRNLSGRVDGSYSDEDGYTTPTSQRLRAIAGSLLWTPTESITVRPSGKYTDDLISAYYATPFIDGEVDPRTRFLNYNIEDGFSKAINNFGRIDVDISLPGGWRLHNQTFAATQRLDYRNMESYSYNDATQMVDVRGYFLIWRDDVLIGNRVEAKRTVDVSGRSVDFVVGGELRRNDLRRAKNPANAGSVRFSVDPFNPERIFDPGLDVLRVPDVLVNTRTLFGEARARITPRWTTILGLSWEQIDVDHQLVVGQDETGNKKFYPTTGRAGVVYAVDENLNLYASYSRSVEPATQFVSISGCCGSAQFFELTPGRQYEIGAKGEAFDRRLEGTLAYYDLEKKNIPTRTLVDDIPTDQLIGRQVSRGIELSVIARPTSTFLVNGDLAVTDVEFADFTEIVAGASISRDGNSPRHIPVAVWSLTPTQQIGPLSVGARVRQVGKRWADTANTRRLDAYTTLDAWVSFNLPNGSRLTLRGRNLTDEFYIRRASTRRGRVAAPRSFEASISTEF